MKLYFETLISPGLKFFLCFNNFKQRMFQMLLRKQRFLNKQSSLRSVNFFLIAACWFKSYPRLLRPRYVIVYPIYWSLRLIIFETLIYRLYVRLSTQASLAICIWTARNSVLFYQWLKDRTDKCSVSEVVNVVPGRSHADKYGIYFDQNAVVP